MPIGDGHGQIVCPGCLRQFTSSEILLLDETGTAVPGVSKPRRNWLRKPTVQAAREFDLAGYQDHCPGCQNQLPPEIRDRPTYVIGLVGESGSAKSHYLAALIKTLTEDATLSRFDLTIDLTPESAEEFRRLYLNPLFARGEAIEGTQFLRPGESRKPLMLIIRNLRTRAAHNILLYDASGEQQKSQMDQARHNSFLYVADAAMLFVTPASLRNYRSKMRVDEGADQTVPTTSAVFNSLASSLRSARALRDDDDLDNFFASVLLTKADQLDAAGILPTGFLDELEWADTPIATLLDQIETDSTVVNSMMETGGGGSLVASVLHRFASPTFHCVSATGSNAVGGTYPYVRPARCVDPFFIMLIRLGIITPDFDWR